MTIPLNRTLDRIETNLPLIPRRIFRLQRAVTGAGLTVGKNVLRAVSGSSSRVEEQARVGVKTVKGQARAQVDDTVETAETEASSLLGRATRAVEGEESTPLDEWTKADLYQRAQELELDGRSSMSKKQLVDALRSV